YPGGHYDRTVLATTRAAGYQAAVTTLHGIRSTRNTLFELPRVRVRSTDSISQVAERMRGKDSWDYLFERKMRRWGFWRPWKKARKKVTRIVGIRGRSK